MKKRTAPKKNSKSAKKPAFGKKAKAKIPALGSGMMGLGATGAQGMLP